MTWNEAGSVRRLCLVGALALAWVPLAARQQPPAPQPVFKTSSTLATLDVVVTDDDGQPVTDLTKEDFEVTVSRKRQGLQQAVFVPANTPLSMAATVSPIGPQAESAPPPPPPGSASAVLKASTLGSGRITRTVAFVVDDLSLSFESTFAVRKALNRYVESQLQPGDLVAIIRTASGVGALQQFTSDRRLLKLAVDRVQWDSRSRRSVASFEPLSPTFLTSPGTPSLVSESTYGSDPASTEKVDGLRRTMTGVGSLAAVEFIARGVQRLPGRKSIVLLSEGFAEMFQSRMNGGLLWNALTRMLDNVNRAGIVLYTIDARGLQTAGLTAEDNGAVRDWRAPTGAGGPGGSGITVGGDADAQGGVLRDALANRNNELINSQESLQFIADQTGGLAFMNSNDIGRAIDKVLADQRGYYLLGYAVPADTPLTGWNQGAVHVRVTRPHTHVRTRQGFFGPASPRDAVKTTTDPLLVAALSPFANVDISARLTSDFWHTGTKSSVQSMLFVDANDIAFSRAADGHHTAQLELGILAVDDNGQVTASSRKTTSWNLTDEQYRGALDHGIVYRSRLFVDRPGAYQIRAAIRDVTTGRTGSSSQFLVIPEVGKGKLALSGLLLKGFADTSMALDVAPLEVATTSLSVETLLGPTIRILNPGSKAVYAYEIYDGLGDAENLQMSTTLLRHGKAVYQSPVQPVKVPVPDKRFSVISIGGALDLGADMPSGPYSLQVDVQRRKSNGKIDRRASQWVDFEIRR